MASIIPKKENKQAIIQFISHIGIVTPVVIIPSHPEKYIIFTSSMPANASNATVLFKSLQRNNLLKPRIDIKASPMLENAIQDFHPPFNASRVLSAIICNTGIKGFTITGGVKVFFISKSEKGLATCILIGASSTLKTPLLEFEKPLKSIYSPSAVLSSGCTAE